MYTILNNSIRSPIKIYIIPTKCGVDIYLFIIITYTYQLFICLLYNSFLVLLRTHKNEGKKIRERKRKHKWGMKANWLDNLYPSNLMVGCSCFDIKCFVIRCFYRHFVLRT